MCVRKLTEFDELCSLARNTQKRFLVMLTESFTEAQNLNSESKSKRTRMRHKRRDRPTSSSCVATDPALCSESVGGVHPLASETWGNLKLCQVIRDAELIKLILRALKWSENDCSVEKLKNTNLETLLNDSDMLHDDDLIKLIKSCIGHDGNNNRTTGWRWNDAGPVTELEVKVDPSLFLPEQDEEGETDGGNPVETDDSRTISVDLNEFISAVEEEGEPRDEETEDLISQLTPFQCTSCPQRFATHVYLQDHVLTHFIKRQEAESVSKKVRTRSRRQPRPKKPLVIERSYKCASCPKAFARSGNCLTHRKRMHPELFQNK